MFASQLSPEHRSFLPEPGTWHWWPGARERAAWDPRLTPARRDWLLAKAEETLAAGWPALPASLFLDCSRTANRVRGEAAIFARRRHLGYLTMAFVVTREPRWLDAALDALWAICEESTWCIPAHIGHLPGSGWVLGLPRIEHPVVDLFAAETAAVVADALDLLGEDLAALDSAIIPRVVHELRVRILDPVANDDRWGWLSGRNNWTPWIAANVGRVVLAHARDRTQQELIIDCLLGACGKLVATYPADGGCDEGIRYWGVSFGTLFLLLEALHAASGGRIALFDDPRFVALATFPVNAHLSGRHFLPFGDNTGMGSVRRALGWHIGERLGLPALQELAWQECRGFAVSGVPATLLPGGCGSGLQDLLWQLWWMPAELPRPVVPPPAARTWLPDLQVLICRSPAVTLAVKGGHNDENHNHNDVGCVHVLVDGVAALIDPGIEAYTMKTFGPERYATWCIRGSGHNAPVVNGHEQAFGRDHAARAVQVAQAAEVESFTADLAACYPAAADVRRSVRTLHFTRATGTVQITDVISGTGQLEVVTTWFSAVDPRDAPFTLTFAPGASVAVSEFALEDSGLRDSWASDRLWRTTVTVRGTEQVTTSLTLTVKRA